MRTTLRKSFLIALIPIRVGKFFWGRFLKDCIKLQEKQKKLCSRPRQNVKLGTSRCSRATKAKKRTKKRGARAKLLFCQYINLFLFFRPRCRRRRLCSVLPLFKYVNHIFRFQALATEGRNVWTFTMIFENGWSPPHAYRKMYIY